MFIEVTQSWRVAMKIDRVRITDRVLMYAFPVCDDLCVPGDFVGDPSVTFAFAAAAGLKAEDLPDLYNLTRLLGPHDLTLISMFLGLEFSQEIEFGDRLFQLVVTPVSHSNRRPEWGVYTRQVALYAKPDIADRGGL